ncbi:MAG: hypothetical protein ACOCVX_01290 [Bacteroidales bacterium]
MPNIIRSLSNKLLEGRIYYDWVVTTAFYSAIHAVDDKLMPLNINGYECKEIEQVRNAYNMKGRHAARERLVTEKLREIRSKYKWLDDKSRYSRYTTYKVTPSEADKAKQLLDKIIEACTK